MEKRLHWKRNVDVKEGKVTEKTLKMVENKGKRGQISVCSQWNLDEDKHVVHPVSSVHWEVFSYHNFKACLNCRTTWRLICAIKQHSASKQKILLSTWRISCFTPGHIPKGHDILLQGHLFNCVHSIFIHYREKLGNNLYVSQLKDG